MGGGSERNIRVVNHNIEAVFPASDDKLRLDSPRDGVVHGLIDPWPHITPLLANRRDFCNLERGIVAQPQNFECTCLISFIDRFKRYIERDRAIRGMQVPDIDLIGPQGFQGILNVCFEDLG